MKYNCHIDVEMCNDRAIFELNENNEIKSYVNSRYISSINNKLVIIGNKIINPKRNKIFLKLIQN